MRTHRPAALWNPSFFSSLSHYILRKASVSEGVSSFERLGLQPKFRGFGDRVTRSMTYWHFSKLYKV